MGEKTTVIPDWPSHNPIMGSLWKGPGDALSWSIFMRAWETPTAPEHRIVPDECECHTPSSPRMVPPQFPPTAVHPAAACCYSLPGRQLASCRTHVATPEAHSPLPLQVLGVKSCYTFLPSLPHPPSRVIAAALPPSRFSRQEASAGLRSPGPPALPGIAGRRGGQSAGLGSSDHTLLRRVAGHPFWQDLIAQVTTILLNTLT